MANILLSIFTRVNAEPFNLDEFSQIEAIQFGSRFGRINQIY